MHVDELHGIESAGKEDLQHGRQSMDLVGAGRILYPPSTHPWVTRPIPEEI